MSRKIFIAIVIGASLFIIGGIMAGVGFAQGGVDDFKTKEMANMVIITDKDLKDGEDLNLDEFTAIDASLHFGDVNIVRGDSYGFAYQDYTEKIAPVYKVENGVLKIFDADGLNWVNMTFDTTQANTGVTITIPQDAKIQDVLINNDGSDVDIKDLKAEKITINNSSGDSALANLECGELDIKSDYGKISMDNVKVATANISGMDAFTANNVSGTLWDIQGADSGDEISLKTAGISGLNVVSDYTKVMLSDITSDNLKVTNSDSDIELINGVAKTANFVSEYGDINLSALTSDNLTVKNTDGKINLAKIIAVAANLTTESSEIKATEMETKGLNADTDYGNIDLSGTFLGATNLTNETGDITVKTKGKESDYAYTLKTEYGTSSVNGKKIDGTLTVRADTGNIIDCNAGDGSNSLDFVE